MFTRCPLCQQDVPNWEYQNHLGQHGPQATARLPVQMMPAPAGTSNAAPGVPNIPGYHPLPVQVGPARHYYHPQCGGTTAMPPHAIHQMSADPFAFGDKVACTGCGKQVAEGEIFWSDSGQSLADFRQELKNNYVYANKLNPEDFEWDANGPVRRKSRSGVGVALIVGGIAAVVGVLLLGGIAFAVVAALSGDDRSNSAPPPPVVRNNTAPVYSPPPSYSGTAMPPSYTPPPMPSYTPPSYPGIESTDEIMARHRRESDQRMKESRERMEQMQRDMERRMEEIRKRRFP